MYMSILLKLPKREYDSKQLHANTLYFNCKQYSYKYSLPPTPIYVYLTTLNWNT